MSAVGIRMTTYTVSISVFIFFLSRFLAQHPRSADSSEACPAPQLQVKTLALLHYIKWNYISDPLLSLCGHATVKPLQVTTSPPSPSQPLPQPPTFGEETRRCKKMRKCSEPRLPPRPLEPSQTPKVPLVCLVSLFHIIYLILPSHYLSSLRRREGLYPQTMNDGRRERVRGTLSV
jgi:hypothetical protein